IVQRISRILDVRNGRTLDGGQRPERDVGSAGVDPLFQDGELFGVETMFLVWRHLAVAGTQINRAFVRLAGPDAWSAAFAPAQRTLARPQIETALGLRAAMAGKALGGQQSADLLLKQRPPIRRGRLLRRDRQDCDNREGK